MLRLFFDSFFIYVILLFLFALGVSGLSSLAGFLGTLNIPLIVIAAIINIAVLIFDFYVIFKEYNGRSIVPKLIYSPIAALKSIYRFQISLLVVESIVNINTESIIEMILEFFGVLLCVFLFLPELVIFTLTTDYITKDNKINFVLLIIRDIIITLINYKIFEWLVS